MEMEAVKLSDIVIRWTPELYIFLTPQELECTIMLRDGVQTLDAQGVLEIVQQSIAEHQRDHQMH